jgi:HD-GYP domain-containing protein (c-di-GMP phosphodiesterase class II)
VLPFSVRILTVADTIDAMVNRRFQRGREGGQRAMGGEEIRRALTGGSGSQFHPEVVREALKMSMFRQQGAASPEKCLVGGGLTSTR